MIVRNRPLAVGASWGGVGTCPSTTLPWRGSASPGTSLLLSLSSSLVSEEKEKQSISLNNLGLCQGADVHIK